MHDYSFFEPYRCYKILMGTPSDKYTKVGNFLMYNFRRLSPKQFEIGLWLLWITNGKR